MRYIIEKYELHGDYFVCRNDKGGIERLDLFTDASFPEAEREFDDMEKLNEYRDSLIGRTIEVDSLSPYIPCYFANGVKFTDTQG